MTTQQKIKALLKEEEIANLFAPFEVGVSVKNTPTLVFPNTLHRKTREEIANFLEQFTPSGDHLTTTHGKDRYEFLYKIDLSSNPNGSQCNIKYLHTPDIEIYLSIPIEWIRDFIRYESIPMPDTMMHYFGGIRRSQIGKLSVANFKAKSITWYGGNRTLVDQEEAQRIVDHIKSST